MHDWLPYLNLVRGNGGFRACLRRSGVAVGDVLELLSEEPDPQLLAIAHPGLTREEILACIAFAADPDAHQILAGRHREQTLPAVSSL